MLSTATKEDSSSEVSSPTTPSPPPPPPTTSPAVTSASVAVDDKRASAGKKATRQWEAWTHEEEESFFIALRNVGKNFDKITSRVQSKNKDQVRHYYYRVIRRINKLLGPGFSLDAKNTKDANSAMLRWWSLLEKQSCSASKLHLKPRRFKTFVTALEHQLLKDRVKANKKKKPPQALSVVVARKPPACCHEAAKAIAVEEFCSSKLVAGKNSSIKLRNPKRQEPLQVSKKRKKGSDCGVSAAAIKRWEKAATAGVSLVAEAAEQVERAAAEQLGQAGPSLKESKLCSQSPGQAYPETFLLSGQEAIQVDAVEYATEGKKLKLQLYPIDEATRKSMEQDGVNPFLQLTLKQRKPVSSVVRHLIQKWGGSSAATGELFLFPFSAQVESMSTCQRWSLHDANVNAGEVYSALGNPTLFRLRYGWISPRILQCPQAECLHLPVSSLARAEAGLQSSAATSIAVQPSAQALPLASLPCFMSAETTSKAPEEISKDFLGCPGSDLKRGSVSFVQGSEATGNELPFVDSAKSRYCQSSSSATVAVVARESEADVNSNYLENTMMPQGKSVDGLIQVDARNAINIFGQSLADHPSNDGKGLPDMVGHKVQESGVNLAACSWLYEGSNDSFVQRIWAIEDPSNAAPLLPTEMDWADTLTNISVGEFLNEVSQTAHMTSGVASIQALQPVQSLDSFDAAVAAQSADVSGIESSLVQHSETTAWDSEETRDAFAFRKLVSQRQTSAPVQMSLEPPSSTEFLRDSDGIGSSFVDCGSLEAWKQSFNHTELSFAEELKYDPSSQFFPKQLEYSGKGSSSLDFTWVNVNKLQGSGHGCP